jgi:cytochrome c oxidase cbb3-type subunit 3
VSRYGLCRSRVVVLAPVVASVAVGASLMASCQREARDLHPTAGASALSSGVVLSELRAGGMPADIGATLSDYQENAYAMNEGKRLFDSYNCSGCHAHGGGSIGPPLMDAAWIYGSEPINIFATIVEGRPNGMPSFRGKVPDFQVAQLVAYVRSMSGLAGKTSSPGHNDAMNVTLPENVLDPQPPIAREGVAPR